MNLSIITINYNNLSGLRKTVESVLSQTMLSEVEYIIIDGASTDGSAEFLKELDEKIKARVEGAPISHIPSPISFKYISEPDTGIYNAMNKGLRMATGDYIQILNSGDILASNTVIERMLAELERLNVVPVTCHGFADRTLVVKNQSPVTENSTGILYGNMLKDFANGKITKDTCGGDDYTPESFLYFYIGTLNHDSAYIRRDLFEKYGYYNEDMRICSDWEWYVKAIALGGEKTHYVDSDVTIFDMGGISESGGKNAELIRRERREYLEKILPASILHDYDAYSMPIRQYQRLKRHHLWGIVWFLERVLFKLEKWGILRK